MEVAFQLPSQLQAHKFFRAHGDYAEECWPTGLRASEGVQASEPGPRTNKKGPCLALFKGVTASPQAINAWLPGSLFGSQVVRIFWLGEPARPASTATSLEELVQQIAAAGPPLGPLRLHCCPRSLESWLADQLPETFQLQIGGASHVLQVVQVAEQCWRHCTQPIEQLYQYSNTLLQRVPGQLSKAAGKLVESLVAAGFHPSANGVAVDVGAAPGGWTAVLAKRMSTVIAIDPAELDPRAMQANVHHLRCRVEDAAARVQELAAGRPLELLCSDANAHAAQAFRLVRPLLQLLRPGGLCLVTLKFCGSGRDKLKWAGAAQEALGPEFEHFQMLWLLANTQNERCVLARRKA